MFLAHIAEDGREQTAEQHCKNTAKYASATLETVGLADSAYLAGLLHDAGKFKNEFNDYLKKAVSDRDDVVRGSVNHTFAGVRIAIERWHKSNRSDYSQITAELLAYAIGSHHGLFDCMDDVGGNGFYHRLTKENIFYEEAKENYYKICAGGEELDTLFCKADKEVEIVADKIKVMPRQVDSCLANGEIYFYIGLLARLLTGAVIEGDRRDTAEFMDNRIFPQWPADMTETWSMVLEHLEAKLGAFPADKEIDKARQYISNQCRSYADEAGGVFRLNVPTGAGKTLSGLRFALAHAKRWNKRRIIFTAPLLSILDQNAQVIRDFVGDDKLILEHHSNLVDATDGGDLERMDLLMQTWDAPIIITTLVQLLNTLFAGSTSCIRRFPSLCNSVLVIDEVQTVPNNMLTLFNLAVNFLADICNATIVLCSATQPSLEKTEHPLMSTPMDIVPWEEQLWKIFKRTALIEEGKYQLKEIPDFVRKVLLECNSLLVVCNMKSEAESLFHELSNDSIQCFHLSATMCAEHRRDTLKNLRYALEKGKADSTKVVCISTQVIEAGVDISFERVIRFAAGMDSVIQAAGRCNRNAELSEPAKVSIIQCVDEKLTKLREIKRGKDATIALLNAFSKDSKSFHGELASDEAIAYYYKRLYMSMESGFQDDITENHGTIYGLLSDNLKYISAHQESADQYFMRQAFYIAGRDFAVFDQETRDVIVPYKKGFKIREDLICEVNIKWGRDYRKLDELIKEGKSYSVSLFQWQLDALRNQGGLISILDGKVLALADGFYDDATGFSLKNATTDFWEV